MNIYDLNSSLENIFLNCPLNRKKNSVKFVPPRNINTIVMYSKYGLFQNPKPAPLVEKPPVERVVSAWQMASKTSIPPNHRKRAFRAVKPRYVPQKTLAVKLIFE